MKLLITGAAGFLGAELVRRAQAQGHWVRAMIRSSSRRERVTLSEEQIYTGDLAEPSTLPGAVDGIEGVIHCAAATSEGTPDEALSQKVNVEGTRALLEAARAAGVHHWVQISSMSAHPGSTSVYGRTKLAADEILRAGPTPPQWTILRPSLIYGPGEKGLVDKTIKLMKKLPVIPVVGSGREPIRPVHVGDVAEAALHCLQDEKATGKTYMIGGADEVTLNEFLIRLTRTLGLRRPLLHIPIPICRLMARILSKILKNPPITEDNVLGVLQAQRVDHQPAVSDWGFSPLALDEGLRLSYTRDSETAKKE